MGLPDTMMVGRDSDLAVVRTAFGRAVDGDPAAVLISGEAGIGKSRLIRELQKEVTGRADIHLGWCLDLGAARTPYGPLTALLRSVVGTLGTQTALDAVGAGANALRMLLPELADAPVDRASTSPEGLRDAIATLIETAAQRAPQVLIIEDLHWADASTLLILAFLMRTIERGRILFLLTCRTDEVRRGDAVSRFIAEASRARRVERLQLDRLDPAAVRELVEQIRGTSISEESAARLLERAEGVPFFIEELACCAGGPLPDGLRGVLLTRFDALDDDARRVVRVASACADGKLPHALLAHVAGLGDEELDAAIRAGVAGGILTVRDDEYGFRHALLREAVHDDLLPGERARLHRAFAEALEDRVGGRQADPATLAFHWQRAQEPARALAASVAAMMRAKESYAFATAARLGELALELWGLVPDAAAAAGTERIAFLARLASILRNAGEGERALAVAELALSEVDPASVDPGAHARLLRDKAQYLSNLGRPGAIELYTDALAIIDAHVDDDRLRANVLNGLAGRYMVGGRPHETIITASEAFLAAERVGDAEGMSVARNLRGTSRAALGECEESLADFREAARLAPAGRGNAELRYRVNYSDTLTLLGRYREAVRIAEAGLTRTRELGVERSSGMIMTQNMVEPLLSLGEIERAEEYLARAPIGRTQQINDQYVASTRVRALAWRGKADAADALRGEWRSAMLRTAAMERQAWYGVIDMDLAVAVARGDFAQALDVVLAMIEDEGRELLHSYRLLLESGWFVAEVRASGEETDTAVEAVRRAWAAVPTTVRDAGWTVILIALLEPSEAGLRAAVTRSDEPDVPAVMRGVVRLELARLLAAAGSRGEAARTLAEAEAIASALGHVPLQRAMSAFRAASGLLEGVTGPGDDFELTPRERQVLDLLAEGLSNRQIGERLFISVKTASVHVSAILRKLGVSTRTEAAVVAARASTE